MRFGEQTISNVFVLLVISNVMGLIRIYKYNIVNRFDMNDPDNQLRYDCRKIKRLHLSLCWIATLAVVTGIILNFKYQLLDNSVGITLLVFSISILATFPWGRWLFKNKDFNEPQENE